MKLSTWLRKNKITAAEFARRGEWAESTVSRWLSGETLPDANAGQVGLIQKLTDNEVTFADWDWPAQRKRVSA